MSKSGGVFQIDDVTRTMSKGGCAPGVPPIQVQTPPPTWLAGYGPAALFQHVLTYFCILPTFGVRKEHDGPPFKNPGSLPDCGTCI